MPAAVEETASLIQRISAEYGQLLRQIRHDLHAHPELSSQEEWTTTFIKDHLTRWDIPIVPLPLLKTGTVAMLRLGESDRAIGLRADIDALPIAETTSFAHTSKWPGRMHACGHDGHTAMLLGAAAYLKRYGQFDGTVYFIFQPAEENGKGAKAMLEAGLFERCPMQAVFGMHNTPGMPTGHLALRAGPCLAASSRVKITFTGQGGHAALPEKTIDPVAAAMAIYPGLQTIISRNVDPQDSAVLSITQMGGSDNHSVIPDSAWLAGSLRTFETGVEALICQRIRELANGIASAYGCTANVDVEFAVPATVNNPDMSEIAASVARDVVGESRVDTRYAPSMAAEDLAFLFAQRPGCYIRLGNGDASETNEAVARPLHNPGYDFNDDASPTGVAYWVSLASRCLPGSGSSPLPS